MPININANSITARAACNCISTDLKKMIIKKERYHMKPTLGCHEMMILHYAGHGA